MPTVGCIGLGVMGLPMAHNLLAAGHRVIAHNRSPAAVEELVSQGAEAAAGPADLTARADIVLTCLPDSPDVEAVVLGDDGVLAASRPGQLLIDCSTIAPEVARALSARADAVGVRALDAPVSGGELGAVEGTLSIMVGGDPDTFEEAKPVLDALGSTVVHVGPAGAGQTVKAANQLIVAGTIELLSEAIVLIEACGVEPRTAIEVLGGGLAGSAVLERKAAGMLARRFEPGFRVDLHHKDLSITLGAAREQGVALPVTALVAQLLTSLRSNGRGELDHSALLTVIEDLSGRGGTR